MKLAVVGSRTFKDYELLEEAIIEIEKKHISTIISGGAKGADSLAARFANEWNIPLIECLPEWKKYGKSAGLKRNFDIVSQCDYLIAFWDGKSKGTKHSIELAVELKKPHHVIRS